jgi:MFS family permease
LTQSSTPPASSIGNTSRWNFFALLLHQILFRIAWIFKTESVIMPAFLDTITESGIIRGALPLLNRAGQSIAPLMLSDRLTATSLKKKWLSRTTFLMGAPFLFLGMSIQLADAQLPAWYAIIFLIVYTLFFCMHGLNDTTYSTVLGKLIRPDRRGRLQAAASTLGTSLAITLALLLLSRWLKTEGQAPFENIFLFVGGAMMLAGISATAMKEIPDQNSIPAHRGVRKVFQDAWLLLRTDAVLRRLCTTAMLFIFSQILFPHYQWLGLSLPGASRTYLMDWVIAQHVGAAVFSSICGFLADRFGTRSALRLLISAAVFAPLIAVVLADIGKVDWYWITFLWIGLVPVTLRMQINYAIEIVARHHHPEYISTLNLCMAIPFLLSPLAGGFVSWFGHTGPFLGVSCLIAIAAMLTWTMKEPRASSADAPL